MAFSARGDRQIRISIRRPEPKSTWRIRSSLLAPTIFERARMHGVRSALLSSKKKTISLLNRGTDILASAETPHPDWQRRLGKAPPNNSPEINYWLFQAALDICATGLRLVCSTFTRPTTLCTCGRRRPPNRREHLSRVDGLLAELAAAAPDAAILVTADLGMNFKSRGWGLKAAHQSPLLALDAGDIWLRRAWGCRADGRYGSRQCRRRQPGSRPGFESPPQAVPRSASTGRSRRQHGRVDESVRQPLFHRHPRGLGPGGHDLRRDHHSRFV
jgi:hypothetical protein